MEAVWHTQVCVESKSTYSAVMEMSDLPQTSHPWTNFSGQLLILKPSTSYRIALKLVKKGPMHGDVCTGNNGISAAGNPQGLRANLCQTTTGELELWMEQMKLDLEQVFRFSICPLCPSYCCQDLFDPDPKL